MAACYDRGRRVGSKARGTRSQFRINSQSLSPFKCTRPVYLTDAMDANQSPQTGILRQGGLVSPIRGGRTVREYDQEIEELRKENFDLKLRLYLIEQKLDKNFDPNLESPVQLDVQLKIETESLHNEISQKDNLLQDALEQVEKSQLELKESHAKNAQLQEQIDLLTKDIGQLVKEKETLEEKVKNSSIAIQGLVYKYKTELDVLPKELRPIVLSAMQAAKEKKDKDLVLAVKDLQLYFCEIMSKSFEDVFENISVEPSQKEKDMQIKCLKDEIAKHRETCEILDRKMEAIVNESKKEIKELKQNLSEKEVALKNHYANLESLSHDHIELEKILIGVRTELTDKSATLEILKKLFTSHEKSRKRKQSLHLVSEIERAAQLENELNLDYIFCENMHLLDNEENLKDTFVQIINTIKENYAQKQEINDKLSVIYNLTTTCSELEQKTIQLQGELRNAISKVKQLENMSVEDKVKLSGPLLKLNALTQTDATMEVKRSSTLSEHSLTQFGHSNNINELKEEICMLLLMCEQRDKEVQELKQEIPYLQAQLEDARNQKEMNSTYLEAGYNNEVLKLHERLARSCNVNNELISHLQNLAVFMEELLQQKNSDSSIENISETSDLLFKLSNCLDQSLLLSTNLSEQLSICEGSKVFNLEDMSMTVNKEPIDDQSALEDQSYQQLNISKLNHDLQAYSDAKPIEGRSFRMTHASEFIDNSAQTGKRRSWSHSMRHESAVDNSHLDPNNVVILETSDNEDLILFLNGKGAPEDVVIRNNDHDIDNGAARIPSISKSDLSAQENQPRRRCWADDFFTGEKSNSCQQVGNITFFNREHRYSKQDVTWNNPCPSSDSDIWSEPDRDVSMQRIGIDIKQSPVQLKSPSRKSRINRDRQIIDDVSSEKSASSHGYVKTQSWSRRRRSSGSAAKRLFTRKDSRLDKQLSLLTEEYSQFTSLLNQFEKVKDLNSNKTKVLGDLFLILNALRYSIGETTQELGALKDKMKNGNPVTCQKCVIAELNLEIENSIKTINRANVFQDVVGTAAEQVIQKLLSEVDNLKKQIEESLLYEADGLKHEEETTTSLQNVIKELQEQNQLIEAELKELRENLKGEQSALEILNNEKNELSNELLDLQKKIHAEKDKRKSLSAKNLELNRKISEMSKKSNDLNDLIAKLESEKDKLATENIHFKEEQLSVNDLCRQLKEDLEQTKAQLEVLSRKCSGYEKDLCAVSKINSEGQLQKAEEQTSTITKLKDLLQNSEKEVEILKQEKNEISSKNKYLICEKSAIQEELNSSEKRIKVMENKTNSLETKIKLLENEKIAWNVKNADQLIQKSEEQAVKIEKLLALLRNNETKVENLKAENEQLLIKNKKLIWQENVFQEKLDYSEKVIKNFGIKASSLKSTIKELENEKMVLNAEKVDYPMQNSGQVIKIEKLQELLKNNEMTLKDLKAEKDELFNKNKSLILDKNYMQEKLDFDEKRINELEIRVNSLQDVVKQLENEKMVSNVKSVDQLKSERQKITRMSLDSMQANDTKKSKESEYSIMDKSNDLHFKKIKSLQSKLAMSEKRIEFLEREKSDIQKQLLSQVHDKTISSVTTVDNRKDDLQLQLENKTSFIKELKSELFRTSNLVVDKETEVDNLRKIISEYEKFIVKPDKEVTSFSESTPHSQIVDKSLYTELPDKAVLLKKENLELKLKILELQKQQQKDSSNLNSHRLSESSSIQNMPLNNEIVPQSIAKNINSLNEYKWSLIKTIFSLQSKFYQEKRICLDHFDNFKKHIENLYILKITSSLPKAHSEPILTSVIDKENISVIKHGTNMRSCLLGLELDIECLQNIKIFLQQFILPIIMQTCNFDKNISYQEVPENEEKKLDEIFLLETQIKQLKNEKDVLQIENTKLQQLLSVRSFESIEKLRTGVEETLDHTKSLFKWEEFALNLSRKLSYVENVMSSLELELNTSEHFSQIESHLHETYSESAKVSLLSKLVDETRKLQGEMEKVSQLNCAFKAMYGFNTRASKDLVQSKFDVSDKESVLSDDTLTLSRSQSLSPVSFDDGCLPKSTLLDKEQSVELSKYFFKDTDKAQQNVTEHDHHVKHPTYKLQKVADTIGSSQDSVCHRSHYSSPDLGIESDPNHESSAPEQAEKDFYLKERRVSGCALDASTKHNLLDKQRLRKPYTYSENAVKIKGNTLHAIGILQEYELLKQEVQESLVGVKSVLSRTSDGLHHIAKYTSPRKSLEYSTLKAIRDTCGNIEVCLTEAQHIVNNFHVSPYPTTEEWNSLLEENQDLHDAIQNLKSDTKKQEDEFNEAMKKLQRAQLMKENMEKKISKKLIKTKKVLRACLEQKDIDVASARQSSQY